MGSFNDNGRNDREPKRRGPKSRPNFETLENRRLLAYNPTHFVATSPNISDVQNGPMAAAGPDLIHIYQQYQQYLMGGGSGNFAQSPLNTYGKYVKFSGDSVAVQVYGVNGDFNSYVGQLQNIGMVVGGTGTQFNLVEGLLPISKLPTVAELPQTAGLQVQAYAQYKSQGVAVNQSETAQAAGIAKAQYGVNGAGVGVGVLSSSVNKVGGGLAASAATGDLPVTASGAPAVNVLSEQDDPTAFTDEGRAMLEHIYDIAPGANLAFHNASSLAGGETVLATGIRRLATEANDKVIVDDVGFLNEPFYQDGISAQAVNDVTANYGVSYFSSAGNNANNGFESPFRGVNGTAPGVGTGRFMNFAPSGTVATSIPVTVTQPGLFMLQFDQPVGGVTSSVYAYLVDASGAIVSTGGNANNVASGIPIQDVLIPTAGSYSLVVQVAPGSADPGRIAVISFSAELAFSQQYGNAGGISYPTTFGHPTADSAIGVGAVAWFAAPAFPGSAPAVTPSETFSSYGPGVKVFNADGSRKASPEFQQTPVISGGDGGNTTFFGQPGNTLPAGLPAQNYNQFNFFGTSDAAPDVAAVAALMKQLSPNASPSEIRSGLIASTIPLNGTPKGIWNVQGGYGLIQANSALNAVDQLRVLATSPAAGVTVTSAPQFLAVQFNRPIDPATLNASDLQITNVSVAGVTITVGQPIYNTSDLSIIYFPLTYNIPAGVKGNATFTYTLVTNSITSLDGRLLQGYSSSFSIADTTPPQVTNTSLNGRIVTVTFSKAMNPATINKNTIYLIRTGSSGQFNNPTNVLLNQDPRLVVNYNPSTNQAILDFSQLDQSELPTDTYALIVLDAATDLVGNHLDGEFANLFPSGNGAEYGSFAQNLGLQTLVAPQILNLGLATQSDTGIAGDQNTNQTRPTFSGQVRAPFPGTAAGLTVVAEFNALHGGTFDLNTGVGGRGYSGNIDVQTTTDANGNFSFTAPANLPAGFLTVRVVVIGAADQPPLPGLSATLDSSFRVDLNDPIITTDANSIQQNATINALSSIVLDAVDQVNPANLGNPFAIPTQFAVPALNPATATNISNYSLYNLGADGQVGGTGANADIDESSFITSAVFTPGANRVSTSDSFTATIKLNFAPGLPTGTYLLFAHRPGPTVQQGITDAAGNAIDAVTAQGTVAAQDFQLVFFLQPTPAYITSVLANTVDPTTGVLTQSLPKSYFELAVPGTTPRATAPPTQFNIDFSDPLNPNADYTNAVRLIRSANSPTALSDGDFGTDSTFSSGVGYTNVTGLSVQLVNSVLGATFGTPGYKNRLVVTLPAGTSLPADHYRLFLPNTVDTAGVDRRIFDIYGNQLDGEFNGTPTPSGDGTFENLLPNGQYRQNDLSGNGVGGGAFETSYIVVPNGNIVYARPDYVDDPFLTSDDPNGSLAHPYPALAPEAVANSSNGGDLNSVANFSTGFNTSYDRNGNGKFDRSALFAADQLSSRGPVVVVALPALTDPSRTFVLQASSGINPATGQARDGSATVPYNTDLVFTPGSILKFFNASLFVQQQGSSIQVMGGPNPSQKVIFTSYLDDTVGGDTNRDGSGSAPSGADWGGVVLRNFDDTSNPNRSIIPEAPGPVDPLRSRLGLSGADDALSFFNQVQIKYAGGAVPQTNGFRFDSVTLFNSRPVFSNITISQAGGINSAQGAISGDMDSFREDNLASGINVRRASFLNNSINAIYIRANLNGRVEPTDAITYPDNPLSKGGQQNYSFFAPVPYAIVARMVVGEKLINDANGQTTTLGNRVYFQPGTVVKFQRGAGVDAIYNAFNATGRTPSINIGTRSYLNAYDANNNVAPGTTGFVQPSTGDAPVLFTSFFDDNATTAFTDPITGARTTLVAPLDTDNGGAVNLPTAGNVPALARWGGFSINSGVQAVINGATFQFGGGTMNEPTGTIPQRDVLALTNASNTVNRFGGTSIGTRTYITNNNFYDNLQAPISNDPNGFLPTDPLRPLISGHPFFRGNIFLRNELNGLEVLPELNNNANNTTYFGYAPNLLTSAVFDSTDLTYLLRSTIRLAGSEFNLPTPGATFGTELAPSVALTIQSALPGTLLANGESIARPGESAIFKMLTTSPVLGDGLNGQPSGTSSGNQGGAGFIAGFDNGIDPPAYTLLDPGFFSQIRILGIPGNATSGQERVPTVITSLYDDTAGRTVRGVPQFQASFGNTTAPAAGDGGVILFGANSLSDYNLYDPRDGNIIDNADIRYMTRIEQQGGGWVYREGDILTDKLGLTPATQFNTAKAMTIANSNLSNFSQAGFIAHPSGVNAIDIIGGVAARNTTPSLGQGTLLFMYNTTVTNTPIGVRLVAPNTDNTFSQSPAVAVLLNDTFNADNLGISTFAPAYNPVPNNNLSHVYFLAMDSIFSNSGTAAIQLQGQVEGSQGQYNLYYNNPVDVDQATFASQFWQGNNQPITGNPQYRDATTGNYSLLPTSSAIDVSRAELGPNGFGNSLQPIVSQNLDATVGTRIATGRDEFYGGLREAGFGGGGRGPASGDIVSLPGYPLRSFYDQWEPAITGSAGAIPGITTNAGGTYSYIPTGGNGLQAERDQTGYLRVDDPNVANVGFGSRPFFDAGAHEYVILNPPHVTAVTAVLPVTNADGTTNNATVPFYTAGSTSGANRTPSQIVFQFDQLLDSSTVNSSTILLQASGGDGIFNNGNDKFFNLSGKLAFDPASRTVSINVGASGLVLTNDTYRVIVYGSGANVIRNPQGLALDGENTLNAQPDNPPLPLPSGDGVPGGNFYLTFTIDTNPPSIVGGTFALASGSDTNIVGDNITRNNMPSFVGRITDIAPPVNPLLNQTVLVDISTRGDGVFDRLGVAQGTTDINGNFVATFVAGQAPLSDSPYNAGPDGVLGTADDSGYSIARVRIIDQSGNVSNLTNANAQFKIDIDTTSPTVTATTPGANSNPTASGGVIPVAISLSENVDPTSVTASSIVVTRAGGDGIFGNGNDVPVSIDPASIQIQTLGAASGAEILRFNIIGATASDLYQITLKGTGASPIIDIAGNPLAGNGTAGTDFVLPIVVFNPTATHILYVNAGVTPVAAPTGARNNPFGTITAAITAAQPGDIVAVLPGVYTESITLKSLVRVYSAATTSTDAAYQPGLALQTIIRAPAAGGAATTTVTGTNLVSIAALETELAGFTIASPLNGNSANGPIVSGSVGVLLTNADVMLDRNFFIDSDIGVGVGIGGSGSFAPILVNNGFIGNNIGLVVNDQGTTSFANNRNVTVFNNDFAFNTYGFFQTTTSSTGPVLTGVLNNIFWQNRDNSGSRNGAAILSSTPGRMTVGYNLFSGNGPSDSSPADDTINVGGGFDPALLPTDGSPDNLGNIVGSPSFVSPVDPRPDASGPGNFFLGANYDLKVTSAAIDQALNAAAPAQDFRFRSRVTIPGRGRAGTGPADIGAFEYNGGGGIGTGVSGAYSFNDGASTIPTGNSSVTPVTTTTPTTTNTGGRTNVNPVAPTPAPLTRRQALLLARQQAAAARQQALAARRAALAARRAALAAARAARTARVSSRLPSGPLARFQK